MMLAGALTGAPGSDPSIDGCARQPSSPTACRCSADAHSHAHGRIRPNSHVANASDDGAQVWGLPSAGCSAHWTRYFTEVYPRKHAEWRAQGRVVVHCCPSSGLGNYLRSLPPALIYSMVTEQALTLACDDPPNFPLEHGGLLPSVLPGHLFKYFHGPHFDWSFPVKLPRGVPTVLLEGAQMNPGIWAWNESKGSRLVSTFATHARRVLLFSKSRWAEKFDRASVDAILERNLNLDGCLLRYLLAPRPALQRAMRAATALTATPGALMPTVTMHVRSGDKAFAHGGWSAPGKLWYAAAEVRSSPFDASPSGAFACLERLSDAIAADCVSCVVVSDSSLVEECARRALPHVVISPGLPIHLAASNTNLTSDPITIQRIFLDWFLLAMSRSTLLLQSQSTFASTAYSFKAASAAVAPHDTSATQWPFVILAESGDPFRDAAQHATQLHTPGAAERWWQDRCRPGAPPTGWWVQHKWGSLGSHS